MRSPGWTAVILLAGLGCSPGNPAVKTDRPEVERSASAGKSTSQAPFQFSATELPFQYDRGDSGVCLPVEPIGGGVGLLDFDGDGDLDIFFAQGVPLLREITSQSASDVLLRNEGNRQFVDISKEAGLAPKGYGLGLVVADYDGDRLPDVYVTRYGGNTLWRNVGGKFVDATLTAGVAVRSFSLGAAFADFDKDGDLDLFVANYLDFDPKDAPYLRNEATGEPEFALPPDFLGLPSVLFRQDEGGKFTDVTNAAGIAGRVRGMGVLAADFDGDGLVDILVANDAAPNVLWRNTGNLRFVETAAAWGIATNGEGNPEANMGFAYGDVDDDGQADVLITHFVDEHDTLWCGERTADGSMLFVDRTRGAGLALASRPMTGWGTGFFDFDHDGYLDFIVANGHIRPFRGKQFAYDNPPLAWRNLRNGRFENVSNEAGEYFHAQHQGRGLAAGDLDGDGDLDLVIVHHHKRSVILWNDGPKAGRYLIVDLEGADKNTRAIGARVVATIGDRTIARTQDGGGSYLSSHDARLHFGLGAPQVVDQLEIIWPRGKRTVLRSVAADRVVTVREKEN